MSAILMADGLEITIQETDIFGKARDLDVHIGLHEKNRRTISLILIKKN